MTPTPLSLPSVPRTPNQWKVRWAWPASPAAPPAAPTSNVSVAGRPWSSTWCTAASARAASTAGHTAATGCPANSAGVRSYIRARAGLTQTNRKSWSRKAIPAGASRSTASGSQDPNSPNPASRCLGTEVSALNRAPHLPRRRLPLAAPSCYRTARPVTHLAPGGSPPTARRQTVTVAVTQNKRATITAPMLPASGPDAKCESRPAIVKLPAKSRHGLVHRHRTAQ